MEFFFQSGFCVITYNYNRIMWINANICTQQYGYAYIETFNCIFIFLRDEIELNVRKSFSCKSSWLVIFLLPIVFVFYKLLSYKYSKMFFIFFLKNNMTSCLTINKITHKTKNSLKMSNCIKKDSNIYWIKFHHLKFG